MSSDDEARPRERDPEAAATATSASVEDADSPSDAFQALGGDPRVRVVGALADAEEGRASFTELFEATDVDTTAGFAYHLRQLDGRFVRSVPVGDDEEAYELTDAGRRVSRAVAAGEYTASVDSDPVPVDDPCPLCGDADGLRATVADNVTRIGCDACERDVLALPFPPSGYATRDPADVPAAVDNHHRRRISAFADGVCPDCGGPAEGRVDPVPDGDGAHDVLESHRVRAAFECDACGATLACPLSLVLLDHPAVVVAYHDHGVDVRDRRLWTAGTDWRERVLSVDPWCVRTTLEEPDDDDDGDVLVAYVGGDLTVVDTDRFDENDQREDSRIHDAGEKPTAESSSGAEPTAESPSGAEPTAESGTSAEPTAESRADDATAEDSGTEDGTPA